LTGYFYFNEKGNFYQIFDLRRLNEDLKVSSISRDFCTFGGRRQQFYYSV